MKYYWISYTKKLANGFGGTAQGPLIRLLPKYKDDVGLLEHEKVHVRQWYVLLTLVLLLSALVILMVSSSLWPVCGLALVSHQLLYKFVRPYRHWSEVQAYRRQIGIGGYASNEFAVNALAEKYDLNLSADEAEALLFG